MEGDVTYTASYNAVKKLIKTNLTGTVTIDYSQFDEVTASKIRVGLSRILGERSRELFQIIQGAK